MGLLNMDMDDPVTAVQKPQIERIIEGLEILKEYGVENVAAANHLIYALDGPREEHIATQHLHELKALGWLFEEKSSSFKIVV